MPEDGFSTGSHLPVAMTTTDVDNIQTTEEDTMTSSSSHGAEFYFQCAVVVIGFVGAATNALIVYAMIASDQHKKHLLIFHQNACDLCSCLLLVITYTLKLCNIRLTGALGYWLCMILFSENLLWCSLDASVINLLSVTVDRYLKVVHPTLTKKLLRKWVIYSIIAFTWIASIVYNMAVVFSTSCVIDGMCYPSMFWKSGAAEMFHAVWYFVSFFIVVVLVFVLCYWRILVVIRRQASVMAGHSGPGPSTAVQAHSHHIQFNVIKTMIIVSAFYVVAWMPIRVYFTMQIINKNVAYIASVFYVTTFVAFLYVCANPFIYATKFDPVKRILVGLNPCKKSQKAGGNIDASGPRRVHSAHTYNL